MNLGSLLEHLPCQEKSRGGTGTSTPHKSPAEGVITAEFAVAPPAVQWCFHLCLVPPPQRAAQGGESAGRPARAAARGVPSAPQSSRIDPAQSVQISVLLMVQLMQGRSTPEDFVG